MDKYRNQYRIESTRLKGYDYSDPGLYFITICTYNREPILGEIKNGVMSFSHEGEIVREEWEKSFVIRSELFCDEYVIMPNHIHAILQIKNTPIENTVETSGRTSLPDPTHSRITPKSISSFVCGFKSAATIRINKFNNTPKSIVWQTRFYDHIIRDDDENERIKQYIINNPADYIPGTDPDHWD